MPHISLAAFSGPPKSCWPPSLCPPHARAAQVRRLVAVLSVRGVSKGALLEGLGWDGQDQDAQRQGQQGRLALGGVTLGEEEVAILEGCGLSRAAGLRSLVNFSGEPARLRSREQSEAQHEAQPE
jgi:hypothetical protein